MMFLNFNFETYSFVRKYKTAKKYKRLPRIYLESRHLSQFSIYNRFQSSWERDMHHFPLFPTCSYLSRDTYASPDGKFNIIFGPQKIHVVCIKSYFLHRLRLGMRKQLCIHIFVFGKSFVLLAAAAAPTKLRF